MKQLMWKEWRELRIIPIGFSLFILSVMLMYITYVSYSKGLTGSNDLYWIYTFLPPISAIIIGSSLISGEQGQGTIGFLGIMPIRPTILWISKYLSGMFALFLTNILIYFVAIAVIHISHLTDYIVKDSRFISTELLVQLFIYTLSYMISYLFDRTIVSFFVSLILSFLLFVIVSYSTQFITYGAEQGTRYMGLSFSWLFVVLLLISLVQTKKDYINNSSRRTSFAIGVLHISILIGPVICKIVYKPIWGKYVYLDNTIKLNNVKDNQYRIGFIDNSGELISGKYLRNVYFNLGGCTDVVKIKSVTPNVNATLCSNKQAVPIPNKKYISLNFRVPTVNEKPITIELYDKNYSFIGVFELRSTHCGWIAQ